MTTQMKSLMFVAAVAILPVACGTSQSPTGMDVSAIEAGASFSALRRDPLPPQVPPPSGDTVPVPPPVGCGAVSVTIAVVDTTAIANSMSFEATLLDGSGHSITDKSCEKLVWAAEGTSAHASLVLTAGPSSRFVTVTGLYAGTYKVGVTTPNGQTASVGVTIAPPATTRPDRQAPTPSNGPVPAPLPPTAPGPTTHIPGTPPSAEPTTHIPTLPVPPPSPDPMPIPTPTEPGVRCDAASIEITFVGTFLVGYPAGDRFQATLRNSGGVAIQGASCEKLVWTVAGNMATTPLTIVSGGDTQAISVTGANGAAYKVGVTAPNGIKASLAFDGGSK